MINRFNIVFISITSVLIATFTNAALAGISISCGKYKELGKNSSELFFNSDEINNSMYRYGAKVKEDTVFLDSGIMLFMSLFMLELEMPK